MGQKGGSYEREICRTLSRWWSNGRREDIFWRSSGSGARAKTWGRRGVGIYGQHGDIAATDPSGDKLIDLLTVEVKRGYSKDTLQDLCDLKRHTCQTKLEGWIQQAEESYKQSGSFSWLLILRRDQRQPLAVFPQSLCEAFESRGLARFRNLTPFSMLRADVRYQMSKKRTDLKVVRHSLCITTLELWLQRVTPEAIKKLCKVV